MGREDRKIYDGMSGSKTECQGPVDIQSFELNIGEKAGWCSRRLRMVSSPDSSRKILRQQLHHMFLRVLFRSDRLKDSGSVPVFLIHIEEQFGILWKFLDPLIQKRREESLTAEFRICKGGALKQKVVHRNKSDGGDDAPVVFRKKKQGCSLKRERERGVIVSCACIYHGLDLVFPERI